MHSKNQLQENGDAYHYLTWAYLAVNVKGCTVFVWSSLIEKVKTFIIYTTPPLLVWLDYQVWSKALQNW